MFRTILAMLLFVGLLGLAAPIHADDEKPKTPQPSVAHVTTFAVVGITIKLSDQEMFSMRLNGDGAISYKYVNEVLNDVDLHKKVTTEVQGKLEADDPDLVSLRGAFAKMGIDTLEDQSPDTEPSAWVIVQATADGQTVHKFRAKLGEYGTMAKRVEPFIAAVTKISDRLK